MNHKTNWMANPTKTQFAISMMLYITSLTIFFAALTDFFNESVNFRRNYVLLFLNIPVFIMMIKTVKNFYKNSIKNKK
ncbi:MAG: hypothetical protein K0R36_3556 [Chryseobacterium sp.]|nr:hypothetical protein [Chryseobacterium sp.]